MHMDSCLKRSVDNLLDTLRWDDNARIQSGGDVVVQRQSSVLQAR